MKKVVIIGASGCGREVAEWIECINRKKTEWEIAGFLDDNLQALDDVKSAYKIIGKIRDHEVRDDLCYVIGIANPGLKEMICMDLKSKGAHFAQIIHPTAYISPNSSIGEGLVAYPNSKIGAGSKVGNFVILQSTIIGHDVVVEDFVTISSGCGITGGVTLKKKSFIGDHAAISIGRTIGKNSYVGIGSVVIKDVEDNVKVFGNPARIYEKI